MKTELVHKKATIKDLLRQPKDPNADRFRICPNCNIPHFVKNKGRDYCSDTCAYQHYNAKRRLIKQATQSIMVDADKNSMAELPETTTSLPNEANHPLQIKHNINILNQLLIDEVHGSSYYIEFLKNQGFDFSVFTSVMKLNNTMTGDHGYQVVYESYRMCRIEQNVVIISKIK